MKRVLITLLLVLFSFQALPQCAGGIIGTASAIPAGSFNCQQQSFVTVIGIINDGSPVTMCFRYYNLGYINLSYLLVGGLCGPFPLYNTLSFTISDSACTTTLLSGTIVPTPSNTNITTLTPQTWYTICYTWVPNCPQFSACPLIYSTTLPIELLYFNGNFENNNVKLKWVTASEESVDKFIIQKTYDFSTFIDVTEIKAIGNSTNTNVYETIDYNEIKEIVYYKLIEVDIDGIKTDKSIIAVNKNSKSQDNIEIFDITGKKINDFTTGVNIVRQGETHYKVIKLE